MYPSTIVLFLRFTIHVGTIVRPFCINTHARTPTLEHSTYTYGRTVHVYINTLTRTPLRHTHIDVRIHVNTRFRTYTYIFMHTQVL